VPSSEGCRPPPRPAGSSCFQLAHCGPSADGLPASLHGHYSASSLLPGSPPLSVASVLSPSWLKPLVASPFPSMLRFSRSIRPPLLGSGHLYAGCRSVRKQVTPELVPGSSDYPGFDIISFFTTRQWFAFVPLPGSYLTLVFLQGLFLHRSPPHPLGCSSGRWFESSSVQAGSRGPPSSAVQLLQTGQPIGMSSFARDATRNMTSDRSAGTTDREICRADQGSQANAPAAFEMTRRSVSLLAARQHFFRQKIHRWDQREDEERGVDRNVGQRN
jgi:hypothetical protein